MKLWGSLVSWPSGGPGDLGTQGPGIFKSFKTFKSFKSLRSFETLRIPGFLTVGGGSWRSGNLGRFGTILGRLGALLDFFRVPWRASCAVLGRSLELLGLFWAVLGPERRDTEKRSKVSYKSIDFASLGPPGEPLEGHLGRLGALLDRLETILGHLGAVLDCLGTLPKP